MESKKLARRFVDELKRGVLMNLLPRSCHVRHLLLHADIFLGAHSDLQGGHCLQTRLV